MGRYGLAKRFMTYKKEQHYDQMEVVDFPIQHTRSEITLKMDVYCKLIKALDLLNDPEKFNDSLPELLKALSTDVKIKFSHLVSILPLQYYHLPGYLFLADIKYNV